MKIKSYKKKTIKILALAGMVSSAVLMQSCGGADGFPDGRVDSFAFDSVTDVEAGALATSDEITISGIDIPVDISVEGPEGSNAEYSINGGDFTSEPGTVENGQKVRVRALAGQQDGSETVVRLTVGDQTSTFSILTVGSAVPVVISNGTSTNTTYGVRLSTSKSGTTFAVFIDNNSVFVSEFDGADLYEAQEIDASDKPASSAEIATDANGNAIAIWVQEIETGKNGLFASYYSVTSESWSVPAEIDGSDEWVEAGNDGIKIAMNDAGQAIAAWSQWDSGVTSVMANVFDGASWGTAQSIEDSAISMTDYAQVDVDIDSNGNAAVVWQGGTDSAEDGFIYSNLYSAGTWGQHTVLGAEGKSFNPTVRYLSSGDVLAVWTHFNDENKVLSSIGSPSGAWSTPAAIGDDSDKRYPVNLELAVDNQGNAMAVYLRDGSELNATRYLANGGWETTAKKLDTNTSDYKEEYTAVALDNAGNGLVVYASGRNISMTYFDVDSNNWTAPKTVDQSAVDAFKPVVSVDGEKGEFAYAWEQEGITAFRYIPENN